MGEAHSCGKKKVLVDFLSVVQIEKQFANNLRQAVKDFKLGG